MVAWHVLKQRQMVLSIAVVIVVTCLNLTVLVRWFRRLDLSVGRSNINHFGDRVLSQRRITVQNYHTQPTRGISPFMAALW